MPLWIQCCNVIVRPWSTVPATTGQDRLKGPQSRCGSFYSISFTDLRDCVAGSFGEEYSKVMNGKTSLAVSAPQLVWLQAKDNVIHQFPLTRQEGELQVKVWGTRLQKQRRKERRCYPGGPNVLWMWRETLQTVLCTLLRELLFQSLTTPFLSVFLLLFFLHFDSTSALYKAYILQSFGGR